MGFLGNYIRNLGAVVVSQQPTRPLLFSYYVTHRCELNCRYCCDGDGKRFKEDPIPELPTSDAKRLLTILRRATDTLDITGGEPLLRGDLEDLLEHARTLGFRTILNTKAIGVVERPALLGLCDTLVLSLDTLDPVALAELVDRPRDIADRILGALRYALQRHRTTGTALILSAVATPDNLAGVSDVLRYARDHGLGFHVSPEIVGTHVNPALRHNTNYRRLIDEVLQAKRATARVLGVRHYLEGIRDFGPFRCYPLLMPTIRPDGRMYYPCLESKRAEISVLDAGSYRQALATARTRAGRIPACRDCCHIFCHMALSLLQRHPLAAFGELRHWGGNGHG